MPYDYSCPGCGRNYKLRQRTGLNRRKCPHCGTPITVEEIDSQGLRKLLLGIIGTIICCGCCCPIGLFMVPNSREDKEQNKKQDSKRVDEGIASRVNKTPLQTTQAEPNANPVIPQPNTIPTQKNAPKREPIPEAKPKLEPKPRFTLAERKAIWEAMRIAEWEAEKATVEKFGHRPRPATDSSKYVVDYRVFRDKETRARLETVLDQFKVSPEDVTKINADAGTFGWKRPALTPIKDLD